MLRKYAEKQHVRAQLDLGFLLMFIKMDELLISLKVSKMNHCLQQDLFLVWEPISK